MRDKIAGALYGMALGDAMGMPAELWGRKRVKAFFGRIEYCTYFCIFCTITASFVLFLPLWQDSFFVFFPSAHPVDFPNVSRYSI